MAHKGEALVRFNGLEAVNGDGLAVAGAAPRKPARDARFAVQSKIDTQGAAVASGDLAAARRGRGSSGWTAATRAPAAGSEDEAVEEVAEAASEAAAEEAPVADDEGAPAAEEAPAAEPAMDPDLAALLKSLG